MTTSIAEWRYQSKEKLSNYSDSSAVEINAILSEVLKKDLSWCLANPEELLDTNQIQKLNIMLNLLMDGFPLAYVLGFCEFYGLKFLVDSNVLIPRPETELLVEHAIQWLSTHPGRKHVGDVGIGSGAILVSVMKHLPYLIGYGFDISRAALNIAKMNSEFHQISNLQYFQMDCLSGFNKKFDVILANLPYIPSNEVQKLDVSRFEPRIALDGGVQGVDIVNKIIKQIPYHLSKPGLVLLEIQFDQAKEITEIVNQTIPAAMVSTIKDLSGFDRIIKIEV